MTELDETHDPARRSWVPGADGHADFPIQNLPLGVFAPAGGAKRGGIAIGDFILDLRALLASGLLAGEARTACEAGTAGALNALLALGAGPRRALRRAVSALLARDAEARPDLLHRAAECLIALPAEIGDYTDFYAGIHHATNVGRLLRPDQPLMPNYKYVPVGYHGRASSVVPPGAAIRRPSGQIKPASADVPCFAASRRLDYELELGIWVGSGNELGNPVPIGEAASHIAGYCLLNDWSARDIQGWEYQPLGPFLAKNFATTISPWIVTPEALAPFRLKQPSRPEGDPAPLPYLMDQADQAEGALDLELEVQLLTPGMRDKNFPRHRLSLGHASNLYWTPAQLLAHHTSGGCNLRPGDLLGSGTISSPTPDGFGSLLEITAGGRQPITLPSGETRGFLEDGDEVVLFARAHREGRTTIGFGECRGIILPIL
jgi:fumarylacetoacetase